MDKIKKSGSELFYPLVFLRDHLGNASKACDGFGGWMKGVFE